MYSGSKPDLAPNLAKATQGVRSYFFDVDVSGRRARIGGFPTSVLDALELRIDLHETGSMNPISLHAHAS